MDKVLDKEEAARFLEMSPRNLNRMMESRLVPYIRVFFLVSHQMGVVFFSQDKLNEYERKSSIEDLEGMSQAEKEAWKYEKEMNIVTESRKETEEKVLALKMVYLSGKLKKMLDVKSPGLSEDEQARKVQNSDMFGDYLALIPKLHQLEKRRLLDFFGDRECLFVQFPELFAVEIKARKEAEAEQAKPKLQRYDNEPPTKKEEEPKNIQVEQIGSELTRIERIEQDEDE